MTSGCQLRTKWELGRQASQLTYWQRTHGVSGGFYVIYYGFETFYLTKFCLNSYML